MALSPETAQAVQAVSRRLAAMEREIAQLRRGLVRTPQLAYSSLEPGQSVEVRDASGQVRGRIGWQPDGTVALVTEGGNPVGKPTTPVVTPTIAGLRVAWDGKLADPDASLPADFDHMAVHVSTTQDFEPSAATYVGTIRRAGEGGMLPVTPLPYVKHYVRLVPVTTGGVVGVPSDAVGETPLKVTGPDITAGSVTAAHIQSGAVTADKLEALLVLGTRILAGMPEAARVELDQDGLRGYNSNDELVFAVDASGNALFSGTIAGSEIIGSRMIIGSESSGVGHINTVNGNPQIAVTTASNSRAQLRATQDRAEFSAFSDLTDPATPATGFVAEHGQVSFMLNSNNEDQSTPTGYGIATTSYAEIGASSSNTTANDRRIALRAHATGAQMRIYPPEESGKLAAPGLVTGFRQSGSGGPLISLQSPADDTDSGTGRRALLHVQGTGGAIDTGRLVYYAQSHQFWMDVKDNTVQSGDGIVWIRPELSIYADRHIPHITQLSQVPSFNSTGVWVPFSESEWPSINFRTSWSGRVRITITAAGRNTNTNTSTLHIGFSLSGGSNVQPALNRAWQSISKSAGSTSVDSFSKVIYLSLAGNSNYTLVPHWRISSGGPSTAAINTDYANEIVVECLM